jgi:NAD(P)H-flavin reductase
MPRRVQRSGEVVSVVDLTPGIVEVAVALEAPLDYRPGQHVQVTFTGFPARDLCPTLRCDGACELNELVFHMRRAPGGAVSAELGTAIGAGHPVSVRGPSGVAYHRPGGGRLVLVSTGAGWGPIWAIARAARFREPQRPLVLVAGARNPADLYMGESLAWLQATGTTEIVLTSTAPNPGLPLRQGRPTLHLPRLGPSDVVHAAGSPALMAALALLARAAEAEFHAVPFLAAGSRSLVDDGDPAHGGAGRRALGSCR